MMCDFKGFCFDKKRGLKQPRFFIINGLSHHLHIMYLRNYKTRKWGRWKTLRDDTKELCKRFDTICKENGLKTALYSFCAVFNVPFEPDVVPEMQEHTFAEYKRVLEEHVELSENKGFSGGITDFDSIPDHIESKEERWIAVWGVGDEKQSYTVNDYKRLDALFRTYSERLRRAGGWDAQQEDAIRSCCQMRLIADKAMLQGTKEGVDMASKLNHMIQVNLSSENLRRKDEKPVDTVRIDGVVDALERAGFLEDGKILPLADVQEKLLRRLGTLGGEPSHKFPYTLDAADQMIRLIIDTMRANDGMPELTSVERENISLDHNVEPEFAARPNDDEQKAYDYMGLLRWR